MVGIDHRLTDKEFEALYETFKTVGRKGDGFSLKDASEISAKYLPGFKPCEVYNNAAKDMDLK